MKKTCTLCKNTHFKVLFKKNKYSIVRCTRCYLVRTIGEQEVKYDNYHRDDEYFSMDQYFRNIFQKRYEIINHYIKTPGKILDIGASTGELLSVFKDKGWETWGIEPSKSSLIAKSRGINVINSQFEDAKLGENSFDVVVMNHTLEHVNNPLKVLRKIYSVLKKDGLAYIDVPNFGSLSSKIAGPNWKMLHPYEHVHQFEPETLKKCMQNANFEIIYQNTWSGIFDVANPVLKFWQTLTGFKKQFFTDLIELPGNFVATMINRGTSLVVIGRKNVKK